MGSELDKFKFKKDGPVIGMMRPFKMRGNQSDLDFLEKEIKLMEQEVGAKNIETILVQGGATRHLRGSDQKERKSYSDLDILIITKDVKSAREIRKKHKHTRVMAKGKMSNFLRNKGYVDHQITLIEGMPIYNREKGLQLQQEVTDALVKGKKESEIRKTAREWQKRMQSRKGKSHPQTLSFLDAFRRRRK